MAIDADGLGVSNKAVREARNSTEDIMADDDTATVSKILINYLRFYQQNIPGSHMKLPSVLMHFWFAKHGNKSHSLISEKKEIIIVQAYAYTREWCWQAEMMHIYLVHMSHYPKKSQANTHIRSYLWYWCNFDFPNMVTFHTHRYLKQFKTILRHMHTTLTLYSPGG